MVRLGRADLPPQSSAKHAKLRAAPDDIDDPFEIPPVRKAATELLEPPREAMALEGPLRVTVMAEPAGREEPPEPWRKLTGVMVVVGGALTAAGLIIALIFEDGSSLPEAYDATLTSLHESMAAIGILRAYSPPAAPPAAPPALPPPSPPSHPPPCPPPSPPSPPPPRAPPKAPASPSRPPAPPPPPCPHPPPLPPPPAPSPSPPPAQPPNYVAPPGFMDHEQCSALFADRGSRFHQLWAQEGWRVLNPGMTPCWGENGWQFFDDAWWGRQCKRNWFSGNQGNLGTHGPTDSRSTPHFTDRAPALLGFDTSIDELCHGDEGSQHGAACVQQNYNILSLYGTEVPYNLCRNLEWQGCAAKGELHGQRSKTIIFSFAPKKLRVDGGRYPLGSCNSYAPLGCESGYASGDIFYLEVCIYSRICGNRNSLWYLNAGEPWQCELKYFGGFKNLYENLLDQRWPDKRDEP
mmetsp:Transcript_39965/g.97062  ORF Transcript_39965/g.97062 Transcript_39965/m.97062 type:complete len:464 (+) Transcript_39965:28-1419(+)